MAVITGARTFDVTLQGGDNALVVTVTDLAGNVSTAATKTVFFDPVTPDSDLLQTTGAVNCNPVSVAVFGVRLNSPDLIVDQLNVPPRACDKHSDRRLIGSCCFDVCDHQSLNRHVLSIFDPDECRVPVFLLQRLPT